MSKPIKKLADLAKEALDMSKEARMARAAEMGFDTEKVFYRGLKTPHSDDAKTMLRGGAEETWLISNPKMAGEYAGDAAGANVVPAHLGLENPMVHDLNASPVEDLGEIVDEAKSSGHDGLILKGFDHRDEMNRVYSKGTAAVVFDKSKIRSTNAKFDPKKKGSGNILDSLGPIAVGAAGVGVASQDAEAAPKAKNLELAARGAEIARQWSSHVWPTEEAAIERLRGWVAHQNRQFAKTFGETVLERDLLDATKISKTSEGYKLVPRLELPQTQPKPQYLTDKDLASAQVQSYVDSVGREFDKRFRGPTEVDVKKVRQGDSSPLDEQNVLQIMEQIKSGESVHPILIEKDGNGVLDGHHRLEAAKRLGIKKIPAVTYGAGAATLAASNDALAADLNSPVASGMGEVASQAGHAMERFDAYTANPFRKFLNSALEGKGIIQSAREGVQAFGAEKPTTGEEVAKNFLSLSPNQNLGFPTADGGKDYPLAGPLGVAVDFAVDPTNIPMAKAVGPSMDAASSISRIIEQSLLKRGLVLP